MDIKEKQPNNIPQGSFYINNRNLQPLSYSCSIPANFNRKVILICSATGIKKEFYNDFASYLSEAGFKVYVFDYAGIGESIPGSLRKVNATVTTWANSDIATMIDLIRKEVPDAELNVVAHSIGGQILGLSPNSSYVKKIIFVASQTGYYHFWKGLSRVKMFCNWHFLLPVLSYLFGYFPARRLGLFENLPKSVALEWSKWCRSPNYLFDFHTTHYYDRIKADAMAITFDDDPYGPRSASDWMMKKYTGCRLTYKHYKAKDLGVKYLGHINYFRKKYAPHFWEEAKNFFLL